MKYVRFDYRGAVRFGMVCGNEVHVLKDDLFGTREVTGEVIPLADVRLLAPVVPPNIIAIGLNYKTHAQESGFTLPERPLIFLKATTSLNHPGAPIVCPEIAPNEVDFECELVAVMGKVAKNVSEADALSYVLGYTCGNDVSARDCQIRLDSQWARGKSFDTFCPIGPWIVTELDPAHLPISTRLNGKTLQQSTTDQMIFNLPKLISYCSRNMTLLPGTLIMTGTPEGVGFARKPPIFLKPGDVVEVEIGGIGILCNPVK